MANYVFFYRIADDNDRDVCAYIEDKHHLDIIGEVILNGACYSGRCFSHKDVKYEDVETFLNKKDFETLRGKDVSVKDFNRILAKLKSEKAQDFFNKIVESEKEFLKEEYSLDDDDIEKIFNKYREDYKDRAIVGCIFDDVEDCGREYIESCVTIESWLENYFDYERFGQDLVNDGDYLELKDGRVVSFNY